MTEKNYELLARNNEFASVIKNTVYTTINGEIHHLEGGFTKLVELLTVNRDKGGAVYLVGNGGSAAVASHTITDFANVCKLRAFTLHDSALITCMSNDFGYDQAFKRLISTFFKKNDILIAISSSGKSANICNAAKMAKSLDATVITFSGFSPDNPLRKLGHLNFWLDSSDYGMVEVGHLFLLHNIADRIGYELTKDKIVEEPLSITGS